jgi:DNA-binding transcriptional LysR family regulator
VARVDWEKQLGRRLKLQALHAFSAVVERGSLSQAARYFGCSQPAISALIAELEAVVGVRLLDRSARGVEPNLYGQAFCDDGPSRSMSSSRGSTTSNS